MKGIGNYADTSARTERKPAQLVQYQGSRAHIRFHDGTTYAMPAKVLKDAGISEGSVFFVVTTYAGKTPLTSRVEAPPPARAPMRRMQTPKTYVRDGRRMATREPKPK